MGRMMRAQVVEAPNRMALKQVPVPEINDDEVLIKVKICGICGTDLKIYAGLYAADHLPLISGHEFWGVVEEIGQNVRGVKVGDRVSADICLTCGTCYFCRRGEGLLCESFTQLGIHTNGAFAEYVKAPWQNCYVIPDGVNDYSAAFIEPMTAVLESSKKMNCTISSSVVIIGCGLGILHAAMAKLRGAAPVMLIGDSQSRLEIAKKMNVADYYINIHEVDDVVAEVKKLTGGVGADFVLEAVGTPATYEQAFKMVRRGGVVEAFGVVPQGRTAQFEPYEFVLGEKKVRGSCAGIGNDWAEVINLLSYKRIDPTPLFSEVVPLEELENSLHELKTNKEIIKIFVSPEIDRKIRINA
ncbi:threonine dehydrogenase-like Zn-dependent dehydrogenase [Hydrogenispora ethanolica]|uniref:Threonine dehydrogenase-like Zn-dependent dehydrogenase n=1 Tax=Hydrogenispora ethanolica TaxID=1082276 RepID=A0A4R1SC52_HYDET|nr:alcohol dehydrogenase catalytic domain-containing protein [Hydrogenispora ethanolica]TCL77019.1 threonine dehydrogenase-like Zn-dependent dehydrogenase [Hydrogenispora ethanolica]